MDSNRKIVVIGAGLTGLSCAYYLQQWGLPLVVLESSNHVGGLISTTHRNGFLFESGPQSPRFSERLLRLIGELNLNSEFVPGDSHLNRFIVKKGRLYKAPLSPGSLLATRLLSLKSKFRILSEPFGFSHPPGTEETIAGFVERKFGPEILDYLVDPIVSTIFFGDARMMGMSSASSALVRWEQESGSVARGAIAARRAKARMPRSPESSAQASHPSGSRLSVTDNLPSLGSFRRGMGTFTEALAKRLGQNIRFDAKVESISRTAETGNFQGDWKVRLRGGEEFFAGHLIVSVPAYEAAHLLKNTAPHLSSLLAGISYAPMAVVSTAYERKAVQHKLDGFGFMVPRREQLHTICTIWNSSIFQGRAPQEMVLLTSFARVDADDGQPILPENGFAQIVEAETKKILRITGQPIERQIWRYARALPQYNLGHAERVTSIQQALGALPKLEIAGNYLSGRSIGDCVETAFHAAESIRTQFQH